MNISHYQEPTKDNFLCIIPFCAANQDTTIGFVFVSFEKNISQFGSKTNFLILYECWHYSKSRFSSALFLLFLFIYFFGISAGRGRDFFEMFICFFLIPLQQVAS